MENRFLRTEMLLGHEAMIKLEKSKVAVFGVGGVGSYGAEALIRSGIGSIYLVDNDVVSISNINRQIHALVDTVGLAKVDAMKERLHKINPQAVIETSREFVLPNAGFCMPDVDYIIDAIDTVSGKLELILQAERKKIPIISAMGTGNKLDPTKLEVTDIFKTSMCPLAKVMRKELAARGIQHLKCVYSKEKPMTVQMTEKELEEKGEKSGKRSTPGSISFVPSVAGLIMAGEVIKALTEVYGNG